MPDIPKIMRAAVYRGVNDLRLETVEVPRIKTDELLVKVTTCGVCPTDLKKIQYGTVPPPRIFGHETAGTIVRVGARVRGFKVGERVALHHHVPCLKCHACRHRAFAQCPQYKRTGITAGFEPAGGGFAEYVRVMSFVLPGVVKIPARNSFDEGAMLEPVNTVLKAVKRLALLPGDIVWVAGAGPIGLMFTRLLSLQGARVVATDLLDTRLKLARQFGAQWTFNAVRESGSEEKPSMGGQASLPAQEQKGGRAGFQPARGDSRSTARAALDTRPAASGRAARQPSSPELQFSTPFAAHLDRLTRGRGLDAAIIAVPADTVVQQALELVRGGGQILVFAHTRRGERAGIDLARVCVDEKDLLGSYSADFTLQREVARLVFSRALDTRRLITHHFPLEEAAAAMRLAANPAPDSLKIMIGAEGR